MWLGWFCGTEKQTCFFQCNWRLADSPSAAWDASPQLGYSCNTKNQRGFKSTLTFVASHEARRRMAVFPNTSNMKLHQTGEPWHLSCHGSKAPAKPHVPLRPCAPTARSPGCRGSPPASAPGAFPDGGDKGDNDGENFQAAQQHVKGEKKLGKIAIGGKVTHGAYHVETGAYVVQTG